MDSDLAQRAISAALSGNWKEAIEFNSQILSQDPKNIDSLNRIARAYAELGSLGKARTSSQSVLKIDPFNKIAVGALERWKKIKGKPNSFSNHSSPDAFLEEPGKTKLIDLLHPGSADVLAKLDCGDEVKLTPFAHRVNVSTQDGKYIGRLPDDLSAKLRMLIKMGNEYRTLVKSVEKNTVRIFIRETVKAKDAENIPSFTSEKIDYVSFTPPELVHKKEEVVEALHQEEA